MGDRRVKIGSLCSGYGGLDMAVEAYYKGETVWMSDIDKASIIAIETRWKVDNLGDLKLVDWSNVEPIDILTAGYPCQPFSTAGQRKGENDPRHLWPSIKEIISQLRPRKVILENVRGHLSLGFKEVLKDLTEIGYDAKWAIIRASDAGAPHRRERLFVLAEPSDSNSFGCNLRECRTEGNKGESQSQPSQCCKAIGNTNAEQLQADRRTQGLGWRFETPFELSMRRTPNPLDQSKLNAKFVEYMMGLPDGWVTDLHISRAQQFKLLGNGVVPQQAYKAIELLESLTSQ